MSGVAANTLAVLRQTIIEVLERLIEGIVFFTIKRNAKPLPARNACVPTSEDREDLWRTPCVVNNLNCT